ncbi:MAG: NTP transferase domain-containing protein, partial [Planctomycetes bacterium]|nr:NTP transferase domain-containing protein [Planctomycetota bacterium]
VTYPAVADQLDCTHLPSVLLAHNPDENSAMIDSVRIGLRRWLDQGTITDQDGFLVCPADHPGISTADFDACIVAFRAAPDRIVIASRAGRRGHPLIFPATLAGFVRSPACDAGLNALPRAFPERIVLVACASPGVTTDIDTPVDFDRLQGGTGVPPAE